MISAGRKLKLRICGQFFLIPLPVQNVSTLTLTGSDDRSHKRTDFLTVRQSGSYQHFRDPASHVAAASTLLGSFPETLRHRVCPYRRGVANNLAPGDAASPSAADDKPASGINQVGRFLVDPFRWHHFFIRSSIKVSRPLLFHRPRVGKKPPRRGAHRLAAVSTVIEIWPWRWSQPRVR